MSAAQEPLEGIAIVGMAGRFPGARNVHEFWRNLLAGEETIATLDEAQLRAAGVDPEKERAEGVYVPRRGLLERPEYFDAAFFGISPREAEVMDPQQRIFLEECWSALEDAGCDPARYAGAVGVFAGMSNNTYWAQNVSHHPELIESVGWLTAMMGNEKDYLATRAAYKLNLRGPAISIHTACSTSLVAVCQAVQALLSYACDAALAGGISTTFPHERGYRFDDGGIVSPDGHCRAFDEKAGGTVFSNGCGVVVLKRLEDAVTEGDQIYAVIKGAALNNDGSGKVSFTAPSVNGHAEVIALAHALAGISPRTIGYIEAHGTGTPLGDPIEIAGLTQAFRAGTPDQGFCALGSVKTNIGHLDAAAGIAGLIKTVLCLRHGKIPGSLHFTKPNPQLGLAESPFYVVSQTTDWVAGETPRRAGVSSFGVGGTNAHCVLEAWGEEAAAAPESAGTLLLPLSAKTPTALAQASENLAAHIESHPDLSLKDLAHTLQTGRAQFSHRLAIVAGSREVAISALRGFEPKRAFQHAAPTAAPRVVFMFPGQASQYLGMGAQLAAAEPVFRDALNRCCELLRGPLELDLRDVLYAQDQPEAREQLRQTRLTQPAIFVISYALAQLWRSWGLEPAALVGHSVGEYVAAVIAGVFSLEDGLGLVASRARLVQEQPAGVMLAVRLPESEAAAYVNAQISLAAINGPNLCVLSGPAEAIAEIEPRLQAHGVAAKRLETSHAFHSAMMEPVIGPLENLASAVKRHHPKIPILSTVTGTWLREKATEPGYWARHARETVRFSPAFAALAAEQDFVFLECGPGHTLSQLARQHGQRVVVHSLREEADEQASVLAAVAQLWTHGVAIKWEALSHSTGVRTVSLPTYPFERKRYFAEPIHRHASAFPAVPAAAEAEAPPEPVVPGAEALPKHFPELRAMRLQNEVLEMFSSLSGMQLADADPQLGFVELGFDSLFLTQAAVALFKRFGVKITFRQLLQDLVSPAAVAEHLDKTLPPDAATPKAASTTPAADPAVMAAPAPSKAHGPFRGIDRTATALTSEQQAHIFGVIERYTARTAGSKRYTAEHRPHLADPRAVAGFRREWKEMIYPLVCDRSEGAKLWDVDGNEYTDITLGFGQILFGHRPAWLVSAMEKQLARGIEIGPTSPLAGELAQRLSRLLRHDRVAFCNTGSEAVAAALRLARTVSGREKVAVFNGAYHGIFDEVLFRPGPTPIAPGIPPSAVQNLIVLDYGTEEALGWLRANAGSLAAVMVEPVQSRHPALVPSEFLKELRTITEQAGAALIFDEIVTGFRVAPGGAQEFFGIRADLATYGKVLGGGMPIGVIAGRREYMDALDGGPWNYGDDSFPEVGVTFFAGTFVRHPLMLAAAGAVLEQLEKSGPDLQRGLAGKASALAARMNAHLEWAGVPLRWETFSSCYHLPIPPELRYAPLIFAHLRLRGIHAWENRPCFLSEAHTEADIERVAKAFEESVNELAIAGLLPSKPEALQALLARPAEEPKTEAPPAPVMLEPVVPPETSEKVPATASPPAAEAPALEVPIAEEATATAVAPVAVEPVAVDVPVAAEEPAAVVAAVADEPTVIEEPVAMQETPLVVEGPVVEGPVVVAVPAEVPPVPEIAVVADVPTPAPAAVVEEPAAVAVPAPVDETPSAGPVTKPVVVDESFPLTDPQTEILLATQLGDEANAAFNDAIALHIQGPIDRDTFLFALNEVLVRRDALRTVFDVEKMRQRVIPPVPITLPVEDVRAMLAKQREDAIAARIRSDAETPFDLAKGPLFRVALFHTGEDSYTFLFTAHHIVCDGWSFGVLAEELASLYSAASQGKEHELPPMLTMREYAQTPRTPPAEDEAWWVAQFAAPPPSLVLPTDEPRGPQRSFLAATASIDLPAPVCEKLRKAAAKQRATVFSALLGAFYALLQRLSGQNDLVVGIASAGQTALTETTLVGHCVNFLPLRMTLDPAEPFSAFLKRVNSLVLDARERDTITLGKLLQKLTLPREPGRIPLTGVSFNVDRAPASLRFDKARAEFAPLEKSRHGLEISFNLVERAGGYRLYCHYQRALFHAGTVEKWLAEYAAFLETISATPTTTLEKLVPGAASEPEPVVDERKWNDTARDYPSDLSVAMLFEVQAARSPEVGAVDDGGKVLNYADLDAAANRAAHRLMAQGVTPGSHVAICAGRSAAMVVAMLAIVKAGAVYVPLDPAWPAERLRYLASDAGFSAMLADAELDLGELSIPRLDLANLSVEDESSDDSSPGVTVEGGDPACVLYTSGSTGLPKGAVIPHRAIARLVLNNEYVPFSPDDVVAHASNPAFDATTFEVWGALLNGAELVIIPRETLLSPDALSLALQSNNVTVLFLTTSLFHQLAGQKPAMFATLHTLIVGGEALRSDACARVARAGAPKRLVNGYGPTEVTTFATWHQYQPSDPGRFVPIGLPIANTTAYVLNEQLKPLPPGAEGELYLGGDGVALGYWKRPELTAERFIERDGERLYRTGDRVKRRADGAIEFLGRLDGQLKLRGFRIELGEIEAVLAQHPDVREAAARVLGDDSTRSLAAYIVARNGAPEAAELRAFLSQRLPDYMVPSTFTTLKALPLNANGKLNRAALPEPEVAIAPASLQPRNETEARVATLMAAVLQRDQVPVNADFFLLGGHSLLAMELLAKLRVEFGTEVTATRLFESPTVEALARALTPAAEIDAEPVEPETPTPATATPTTLTVVSPMPVVRVQLLKSTPAVRQTQNFQFLVPIQAGDSSKRPFFMVAGGWGGEIEFLVYRQLAQHLDPTQPFWGFKARGAGSYDPPHETVTEMAADYLKELRALQPDGPYLLGGECVGGICAYEMACQLRDAGEEVSLLLLLDTSVPSAKELSQYEKDESIKRAAEARGISPSQLVRKAGSKVKGLLRKLIRNAPEQPGAKSAKSSLPPQQGQPMYPITLMRHILLPYDGHVTLVVDQESHRLHGDLGWEKAPVESVGLLTLPGDHISYIREHSASAAARLREILAQASLL